MIMIINVIKYISYLDRLSMKNLGDSFIMKKDFILTDKQSKRSANNEYRISHARA